MNIIEFGDCREIMKKWATEGVKAQTCVTSPPYFALRDYHVEGQIGLETTPDAYVAEMVEVFRCVRDVLADDGTLWLNIGDSYCGTGDKGEWRDPKYGNGRNAQSVSLTKKLDGYKSKDLIGIPWMLAFALRKDGWYLRQDIIWNKPNAMPESVRDRCTKAHEYIFLLSKSKKYYFDHEAMKEPSANGSSETRNRRSVWSVNTRPYKGAHFATFPPDLIEPCILAGSRSGDVVLDPFMGSGTTAMVALKHGRKYLGCELNHDYKPLQDQRIASVKNSVGDQEDIFVFNAE